MAALPVNIPINSARLPQSYEAAKVALANCVKLDECKAWTDKAAAMASYARQADDDSIFRYAKRIQARAVRRAGELPPLRSGESCALVRPASAWPCDDQLRSAVECPATTVRFSTSAYRGQAEAGCLPFRTAFAYPFVAQPCDQFWHMVVL